MNTKYKLKRDKFRKARGGYSRFLNIYCSKCNNHLLLYQKDGPGPLKRMYLDRILAPENLSTFQYIVDIKSVPNLICKDCNAVIGTPYIYEKENRKAFLLNPVTFIKRIGKGEYP